MEFTVSCLSLSSTRTTPLSAALIAVFNHEKMFTYALFICLAVGKVILHRDLNLHTDTHAAGKVIGTAEFSAYKVLLHDLALISKTQKHYLKNMKEGIKHNSLGCFLGMKKKMPLNIMFTVGQQEMMLI